MPYRVLLLAICISYLGIVEAQTQGSQVDADLHCLAVMAKINQLPDARHQLESLIGGYYYLGRLQAAAPSLDLGQSTADA